MLRIAGWSHSGVAAMVVTAEWQSHTLQIISKRLRCLHPLIRQLGR